MESILHRKEKTLEEFRREKSQIESTQNTVRTLGESHTEEINNIKVSLNLNLQRMLLTHRQVQHDIEMQHLKDQLEVLQAGLEDLKSANEEATNTAKSQEVHDINLNEKQRILT